MREERKPGGRGARVTIPEGFAPFDYTSPFLSLIGPLHARTYGEELTVGLMIEDRHCNRRGIAHGGLLATLADIALGYTAGHGKTPGRQWTTAALTVEFLGAARIGDWVEGRGTVLKTGQRLAYASCLLSVGSMRIVHASGIFSIR